MDVLQEHKVSKKKLNRAIIIALFAYIIVFHLICDILGHDAPVENNCIRFPELLLDIENNSTNNVHIETRGLFKF